jgi:fatty acid desaturase
MGVEYAMEPPMNESVELARRVIWERLGKDRIQELHRENRLYDYTAVASAFGSFSALVACLATLPFGPLWFICLILQGFVLQIFALINHDLIMHRLVLPQPWAYRLSLMLTIPVHLSPTRYYYGHTAHHKYLGRDGDSELFKIDIDTPAKRFLYATIIGMRLASAGAFARIKRRISPPIVRPDMHEVRRHIGIENRLITVTFAISVGLAFIWPNWVFFGYLLPLIVVTPIASTLRTVLEHSEYDSSRPFQLGCFYRTTLVTRVLFFWDSGDCHCVHHLFPRVPFYRIGAALRDMRPIFLEKEMIERRSLTALLWIWFKKAYPYRSPAALSSASKSA